MRQITLYLIFSIIVHFSDFSDLWLQMRLVTQIALLTSPPAYVLGAQVSSPPVSRLLHSRPPPGFQPHRHWRAAPARQGCSGRPRRLAGVPRGWAPVPQLRTLPWPRRDSRPPPAFSPEGRRFRAVFCSFSEHQTASRPAGLLFGKASSARVWVPPP